MPKIQSYGLEHARAQLPKIASEALAGYASVITRHGKPVAAVVPLDRLEAVTATSNRAVGLLPLRGSGKGLWPEGVPRALADLRDEWGD